MQNHTVVLFCSCRMHLSNYMNFNDIEGVYTYSFEAERKADCLICSKDSLSTKTLEFNEQSLLDDVISHLMNSPN